MRTRTHAALAALTIAIACPYAEASKIQRRHRPVTDTTVPVATFEPAIDVEPLPGGDSSKPAAATAAPTLPQLSEDAHRISAALWKAETVRLLSRNNLSPISLLPTGPGCESGQFGASTLDAKFDQVTGCARFVENGFALRIVWQRHGAAVYAMDQWRIEERPDPNLVPLGATTTARLGTR